MKAYVVLKGNGQLYEYFQEEVVKSFFDKSKAEEYVESHNKQLKESKDERIEKSKECSKCIEKAMDDPDSMVCKSCFEGDALLLRCSNRTIYPIFSAESYRYIEIEIE